MRAPLNKVTLPGLVIALGIIYGDIGTSAAESARLYEVHPLDHLHADREAEARGLQIAGVYHSHTHTDAYPSPTDVAQAPDPEWHYVVVSLREDEPMVRSYRIVDGEVSEEPIVADGLDGPDRPDG